MLSGPSSSGRRQRCLCAKGKERPIDKGPLEDPRSIWAGSCRADHWPIQGTMPALRIVSGREMRNDTRLRRPSKNLLVAIEVSIVG